MRDEKITLSPCHLVTLSKFRVQGFRIYVLYVLLVLYVFLPLKNQHHLGSLENNAPLEEFGFGPMGDV
jgi:hypothetical protein